jgi:hypothetical protein
MDTEKDLSDPPSFEKNKQNNKDDLIFDEN